MNGTVVIIILRCSSPYSLLFFSSFPASSSVFFFLVVVHHGSLVSLMSWRFSLREPGVLLRGSPRVSVLTTSAIALSEGSASVLKRLSRDRRDVQEAKRVEKTLGTWREGGAWLGWRFMGMLSSSERHGFLIVDWHRLEKEAAASSEAGIFRSCFESFVTKKKNRVVTFTVFRTSGGYRTGGVQADG